MSVQTARIRPFTPTEYSALGAAYGRTYPDYPWSVEEMRHQDETFDTARFFKMRLVAEEDGAVVGAAEAGHRPSRFDPDSYHFDLWVVPDRRRRGHGSALRDAVIAALRARDARGLGVRTGLPVRRLLRRDRPGRTLARDVQPARVLRGQVVRLAGLHRCQARSTWQRHRHGAEASDRYARAAAACRPHQDVERPVQPADACDQRGDGVRETARLDLVRVPPASLVPALTDG